MKPSQHRIYVAVALASCNVICHFASAWKLNGLVKILSVRNIWHSFSLPLPPLLPFYLVWCYGFDLWVGFYEDQIGSICKPASFCFFTSLGCVDLSQGQTLWQGIRLTAWICFFLKKSKTTTLYGKLRPLFLNSKDFMLHVPWTDWCIKQSMTFGMVLFLNCPT